MAEASFIRLMKSDIGQELQIIRADLKAAAIGGESEIRKAALELGPPKTWITIADDLADTDMVDLRISVYAACGTLGIDANHMLWTKCFGKLNCSRLGTSRSDFSPYLSRLLARLFFAVLIHCSPCFSSYTGRRYGASTRSH